MKRLDKNKGKTKKTKEGGTISVSCRSLGTQSSGACRRKKGNEMEVEIRNSRGRRRVTEEVSIHEKIKKKDDLTNTR